MVEPYVMGAVGLPVVLQVAILYLPMAQTVFATATLSVADLATSAVVASIVFWAAEPEKLAIRRWSRRPA